MDGMLIIHSRSMDVVIFRLLLFLSDLSDYEGGELTFQLLAGFERDSSPAGPYCSLSKLVIALCKACREWCTIGLCWMD
jgi:hypothetical protein